MEKLLIGIFHCEKDTLLKMLNALENVEKFFGPSILKEVLECIIFSVEKGTTNPLHDIMYYAITIGAENYMGEQDEG